MPPPTMPDPPTMPEPIPEPMRQQVLDKINEIQQAEGTSGDDVVADILGMVGLRPSGISSTSRGIAGTLLSSSATADGQSSVGGYFIAEYDPDGTLQFSSELQFLTSGERSRVTTSDPEATTKTLTSVPAAGWKGVELQADTNSWHNYTDLFSDIESNADTDYLAMGYWLRERRERSTTRTNYVLAIGAGGNDPFQDGNVDGLTGTATYEGPATGIHMIKENASAAPVFDYFDATARLTADFGDANSAGSVSGTIVDGMTVGGEPVPVLTLESASFVSSRRSFYGNTSGNGLTGQWGGKFYSNGAAATDYPGSAAGTFGAKTSDDLQSLIGAFAVYEQ